MTVCVNTLNVFAEEIEERGVKMEGLSLLANYPLGLEGVAI
jgi:hypothetical protein